MLLAQWSLKMETAEHARRAIRDAAATFYVVAGIHAVVFDDVWHAVMLAGLGF